MSFPTRHTYDFSASQKFKNNLNQFAKVIPTTLINWVTRYFICEGSKREKFSNAQLPVSDEFEQPNCTQFIVVHHIIISSWKIGDPT